MVVFAVPRSLVLSLAAVLLAVPASAQSDKARSPQVTVTVDFLRSLESGQIAAAQALLDPAVSRAFPAARLAAAASKGKLAKGRVRQLQSEGKVAPSEAFANQLRRRPMRNSDPAPAYVVCMADVPVSGYGSVTYVTVILVSSERHGWQVSDFRYQSEPDHLCEA